MKTRIADLRISRGWSQTDLAERAGVRQGTISDIERGLDPRLSTLEKIAGAFGVDAVDLFDGNGDASMRELIVLWSSLPDSEREAILTLLRRSARG